MKISIEQVYDDLYNLDIDGDDGLVKIHDDDGLDDMPECGDDHTNGDPEADSD